MVNAVEKRPDVQIYHPVVLPTPLPAATHRVQRRPSRAVTIGVGVENRFDRTLQLHGRHRLGDPVSHSWHPEDPDPSASCFRYLHGLHRRREVTPRRHAIPQLKQVILQIPLSYTHLTLPTKRIV